jgi:hypothetical protein
LRIYTFVLFLVLAEQQVFAASWGDDMFAVKTHNFGNVALGSEAVYRFEMVNVFQEDIRILGVYSSCGCTTPSASTKVLKSEEKGAIIAKLNTDGRFLRDKGATLTVNLETVVEGLTVRETVQLSVKGYIRPDVVLTPGSVEFGSVNEGQSATQTVQLTYSGRSDWALTAVNRSNPLIYAKADEVKRYGGEVSYLVTVMLRKDAPAGYIKDVLRFTTNEEKAGTHQPVEIELPIQAVVKQPLRVTPSPMMIGLLAAGDSVAKNIVLRNDKPFKITGIDSADKRFRFTFSEQASSIQLVSVLFSAKESKTEQPQTLDEIICIKTTIPDKERIDVNVKTLLVP